MTASISDCARLRKFVEKLDGFEFAETDFSCLSTSQPRVMKTVDDKIFGIIPYKKQQMVAYLEEFAKEPSRIICKTDEIFRLLRGCGINTILR